jgi:hypothetical protein
MGDIAHPSSGILMDSKSNAVNAQVCWKVTLIVITAVGIDVGLESCNHINVFGLQDVVQKMLVCVQELKNMLCFD